MFKKIADFFFDNTSIRDNELYVLAKTEFGEDAEYAYQWIRKNKRIVSLQEMK